MVFLTTFFMQIKMNLRCEKVSQLQSHKKSRIFHGKHQPHVLVHVNLLQFLRGFQDGEVFRMWKGWPPLPEIRLSRPYRLRKTRPETVGASEKKSGAIFYDRRTETILQ